MPQAAVLKKGRKFDQVLEAACKVFLSDGYERANMDDIAREAGVSKATVYSYFPDKRLLFLEAAKTEISRQTLAAEARVAPELPMQQVLEFSGRVLTDFFLSNFGKSLFRLCVAEAETFPQLGRMFYELGPKMARDRLANYFQEATKLGHLKVDDPVLAAEQFIELCKTRIFVREILGVDPAIEQADKDRVVKAAVEMFMARYGTS